MMPLDLPATSVMINSPRLFAMRVLRLIRHDLVFEMLDRVIYWNSKRSQNVCLVKVRVESVDDDTDDV